MMAAGHIAGSPEKRQLRTGQKETHAIFLTLLTCCLTSPGRGAAREHRDPSQPGYRLRKIQCISQRTWNRLRLWLREPVAKPEASAPRPPRGEGGAEGRSARKTFGEK